jgi:hypothetical protein
MSTSCDVRDVPLCRSWETDQCLVKCPALDLWGFSVLKLKGGLKDWRNNLEMMGYAF